MEKTPTTLKSLNGHTADSVTIGTSRCNDAVIDGLDEEGVEEKLLLMFQVVMVVWLILMLQFLQYQVFEWQKKLHNGITTVWRRIFFAIMDKVLPITDEEWSHVIVKDKSSNFQP